MTIIRNLIPNPSGERGTDEWRLSSGSTGTLSTTSAASVQPMAGRAGRSLILATASGTQTTMQPMAPYNLGTGGVPVNPDGWVGGRVFLAHDRDPLLDARLRLVLRNPAGDGYLSALYRSVPFYEGGHFDVVGRCSGAVSVHMLPGLRSTDGAVIPAGSRLWVDQAMIVAADTEDEVRAAIAAGYRDGDSPGWRWEGTPHASSSIGILGPYAPEAVLLRAGTVVDYLDLMPGFDEAAAQQSIVQRPLADPAAPPAVTIRAAGIVRGQLRAHLTTATGYGEPGDRAEALAASLRTGQPHTLRMLHDEPGLRGDLELVPAGGSVRRSKEPGSNVWTVATDFERAPR